VHWSIPLVTALFALLGAPPAPAAANTTDPNPCATADALFALDLLDDAAGAYKKVVEAERDNDAPAPKCAVDGLAAVDRRRSVLAVEAAERLREAGFGTAASEAVRDALKDQPTKDAPALEITDALAELGSGERAIAAARVLKKARFHQAASTLLEETLKTTPDAATTDDIRVITRPRWRIAAAEALAAAGFRDAAAEQVKATLEARPNADVPDSLKESTRRVGFWQDTLGAIGPWLVTVGEIVALLLLVLLITGGLWSLRPPKLIAGGFSGGPGDKAATELAAAVSARYRELRDQNGGTALTQVEPAAEAFAPPASLTTALPHVAIVTAIVTFLSRMPIPKRWTLVGELRERDPVRGAGLTVRLPRTYGRKGDEVTLWESDYGDVLPPSTNGDPLAGWRRLALPAAAWLVFHAPRVRPRTRKILGTSRWESYAHFTVGCAFDLGTPKTRAAARERYRAALAIDPKNLGAAFNVAVLDHRDAGDDQHSKRALDSFEEVRERVESEGEGKDDPMWYRARAMEVVVLMDLERAEAARAPAYDLGIELLERLIPQRSLVPRALLGRRRRALRALLVENEANALIFVAAVTPSRDPPSREPAHGNDRESLRDALKRKPSIQRHS
jgi:tetratricopeptide (TPR) repeat protein